MFIIGRKEKEPLSVHIKLGDSDGYQCFVLIPRYKNLPSSKPASRGARKWRE